MWTRNDDRPRSSHVTWFPAKVSIFLQTVATTIPILAFGTLYIYKYYVLSYLGTRTLRDTNPRPTNFNDWLTDGRRRRPRKDALQASVGASPAEEEMKLGPKCYTHNGFVTLHSYIYVYICMYIYICMGSALVALLGPLVLAPCRGC